MERLRWTNERCYICDFSAPVREVSEGDYAQMASNNGNDLGLFYSGLSDDSEMMRYVYIHPVDRRPICTVCNKVSETTFKEMEWKDRGWEPIPFNSNEAEFFTRFPADMEDQARNIKWDKVSHPITFPLPVYDQPRPLGWRWHTRASLWPLTDTDHESIRSRSPLIA